MTIFSSVTSRDSPPIVNEPLMIDDDAFESKAQLYPPLILTEMFFDRLTGPPTVVERRPIVSPLPVSESL